MNIFTDEFIKQAHDILKNKCYGNQTFFKKDFASELGFDPKNSKKFNSGLNIISTMFDLGLFSDYKVIPGKHGGIIHVPSYYKNVSSSFPKNFLEDLFKVLNKSCFQAPVSRTALAKQMQYNLSEEQICTLISLALQKKYITGFIGKVGKNGGILKDPTTEPKLTVESPETHFSRLPLAKDDSMTNSTPGAFWESLVPLSASVAETEVSNEETDKKYGSI